MAPAPARIADGLPEVYPDEPLDVAMTALRREPCLLVVSRGIPSRTLGTLSREDVVKWLGVQDGHESS